MSPLWDNPLFKRNNSTLKSTRYPILSSTVPTVGEFYGIGLKRLMTHEEFTVRYGRIVEPELYTELRYIITSSIRSLGVQEDDLQEQFMPSQPLIFNIALSSKKGCSLFYKILTKKSTLSNKIYQRENNWHNNLGTIFSIDFWQETYKQTASLKYENKLKWLQYQINRGSLKTNYIVSHFLPNVSPLCHYCGEMNEKIEHLFYSCRKVNQFWVDLEADLLQKLIHIPTTRAQILFGKHDEKPESVSNYILLAAKQYIWINKFKTPRTPLSVRAFNNILKHKIEDRISIASLLGKHDDHDYWSNINVFL